jgi:hypothetical protein
MIHMIECSLVLNLDTSPIGELASGLLHQTRLVALLLAFAVPCRHH